MQLSPAIRPSPRPMNEAVLASISAAQRAVVQLQRHGFSVIGIDVFGPRSTIQVQNCPLTDAMIREERACYYKWQKEDGVHQRFGQFQVENCRVIWVERGH